jgi:hypothetical protein
MDTQEGSTLRRAAHTGGQHTGGTHRRAHTGGHTQEAHTGHTHRRAHTGEHTQEGNTHRRAAHSLLMIFHLYWPKPI